MAVDPIDWNAWRAEHEWLDFHDQQEFYKLVAEVYPEQQHFTLSDAEIAFNLITGADLDVIELGGWDGALASALLSRFPISRWQNYDIVGVPQVCDDPRYFPIVLGDYFWNYYVRASADVFVATHTIEHLTGKQLIQLLDSLDTRYIYLEAPIGDEGQDWTGYRGSHILELGWRGVADLLSERGYERTYTGRETGLWAR